MQCAAACGVIIPRSELLVCYVCKDTYHHSCVNITTAQYLANISVLKTSWRCQRPACSGVIIRKDSTPVGKRDLQPLAPTRDASNKQAAEDKCNFSPKPVTANEPIVNHTATTTPATHDSDFLFERFEKLLNSRFEKFGAEITAQLAAEIARATSSLSDEIKRLTSDVTSVRDGLMKVVAENTDLKRELEELKKQCMSSSSAELQEAVEQLKAENEYRNRVSLLNDVEITCVPEHEGESVGHIVAAVALKLGVPLDERDVVSAMRVGRHPATAAAVGARPAQRNRPRPIVVSLARRSVRDQLINGAKVRRGTTTDGLGLPNHSPQNIHINERLTKCNRVLLAKARTIGKEWGFIWTRDGRVQARREKDSKRHYINSEADLKRVFGSCGPPEVV